MLFSEIPGLTSLKKKLTHAVKSNHVAHAQLFAGSPGALNLPMATAFSQYLHCTNQGEDACGQCLACVKSAKFIHPDTHFFFPYTAKTDDPIRGLKEWRLFLNEKPFGSLNDWTLYYKGEDKNPVISVETGREMLRSLLLKPYESRCKAAIVWLPEFMHFSTSNVILKMLEEPPPQTYFILVTNGSEQLLPTIISRTQSVHIPMLTDEELRHYLTSKHTLPEKQLTEIIQLSEGNISAAENLLQQKDNRFDYFFNWMLACYSQRYAELIKMADEFHEMDKQSQQVILLYALTMLRETVMQLAHVPTLNRLQGEQLERVAKLSRLLTLEKLEIFYRCFNDAPYQLERNGSAKMIFMNISLQAAKEFNSPRS